jgi:diguanylate cyclase (GGDEF)-like protein
MFKQRLRRTDLIGRNGGDEFAVSMPDTTSDEAASVIDHLRVSFAIMHHHTPETTFTLNFSSGIAAFPDYKISNLLVQAADQALYEAKRRGRNRVIQALHLEEPPDLIR